ncbi:MAG: HD domain-containing protein [Dehalococcoidales bacterium]|nr:MAG: HD domain-containing protein [Dehalococcoidales bacterium]
MDYKQIIERVESFAIGYYERVSARPTIWETHVRLVRKYTRELAEIENVDSRIIEIAAILHDIGRIEAGEGHYVRSHDLSKPFLETIDLSEEDRELILECILKHSMSYASKDNSIEVRIIQCADALANLFDEELQDYSRKTMSKDEINQAFLKLLNKITLDSARAIAEPRVQELKALLDKD